MGMVLGIVAVWLIVPVGIAIGWKVIRKKIERKLEKAKEEEKLRRAEALKELCGKWGETDKESGNIPEPEDLQWLNEILSRFWLSIQQDDAFLSPIFRKLSSSLSRFLSSRFPNLLLSSPPVSPPDSDSLSAADSDSRFSKSSITQFFGLEPFFLDIHFSPSFPLLDEAVILPVSSLVIDLSLKPLPSIYSSTNSHNLNNNNNSSNNNSN